MSFIFFSILVAVAIVRLLLAGLSTAVPLLIPWVITRILATAQFLTSSNARRDKDGSPGAMSAPSTALNMDVAPGDETSNADRRHGTGCGTGRLELSLRREGGCFKAV